VEQTGQLEMSFSSIHAGCSASPGGSSDCIDSAMAAESGNPLVLLLLP
jgi:hypothetical protein